MTKPRKDFLTKSQNAAGIEINQANPLVDEYQVLKRMSQSAGEVFWTADLDLNILYISPSVFYLTGDPPEVRKKKSLTDMMPPESVALIKSVLAEELKLARTRGAESTHGRVVEVERYDKDGTRKWVSINASGVHDENGVLIGIQGITRNIHETKTAQLKLAQSEARFRMLAENLHGVIYLCRNDERYKMEYISESISDLLGYPAEVFTSDELSFAELYHPDDRAGIYETASNCVAEGKNFHLVYRAKHKDCSWRWIEEKGKEIENERGEKLLEGFLTDVTERVNQEEQVRESQGRYEQLFNANNDSISLVYLLPNGELSNFIEVNDAAGEVIGYTREELLQLNIRDLEEPGSAAEIEKRLTDIKQRGASRFETRFVAKDGSIVTFDVKSRLIDYQGRPALLNISRDITQGKIAQKKLEESEEKFLKAFHNSPNIIGLSDVETGEYLEVNQAFTAKTGYTPDDVKGKKIVDLLQMDPDFREKAMAQLMQNGCVRDLETVLYTKTKQPLEISMSADLITIQGKQYNLTTGIDIGPIKQAERELIQAKELAEESSRLKSNFLSNMSHELRTPLNGILGFAQLLKERFCEEPELDMVNMIYASGKRLLKTLNNIMELSKLDSGHVKVQSQSCDLVLMTANAVKHFGSIAQAKNLNLRFSSPYTRLRLTSDVQILEKIIHELINNALAFTYEGEVVAELSTVESDEGKKVILAISDTGIGITAEHQGQIFEPFRQASEGWNRSYEGTGLGLTICERFARALGAEIKLISEPGIGSTFSLGLPYSLVLEEDSRCDGTLKSSDLPLAPDRDNAAHILLVDDDKLCEILVRTMLQGHARLDYATCAIDALKMLEDGDYELILLDINLRRGIDGTQLLTRIKQIPKCQDIPLIALTAYASQEERAAFMEHGFSDYLSKPFLANDLRDIVKKWSKKGSGE